MIHPNTIQPTQTTETTIVKIINQTCPIDLNEVLPFNNFYVYTKKNIPIAALVKLVLLILLLLLFFILLFFIEENMTHLFAIGFIKAQKDINYI